MESRKSSSSAAPEFPQELANGLRNYWYPVFLSEDLPSDKPVALRRLGEDLVLWRGPDGKPHLFADYCAHRGAPLSLGKINEQGRLQCWYHGLEYDGDGQCRNVPFERQEDGPLAKPLCVQSYPAEDRAGFIWAYIGDVETFPPPPLVMEPEAEGPNYHAIPYIDPTWDTAWPLAVDNGTDPTHPPFLHRDTASQFVPLDELFDYFTPREINIETTDGDIRLGGSRGPGVRMVADADRGEGGSDIDEFFLPSMVKIVVLLPGGGEPVHILGHYVPIDDRQILLFELMCRKVKNDAERKEWDELWKGKMNYANSAVNAQDKKMTEAQGAVNKARSNEHLLPMDREVTHARRLIMKAWQAQEDTYAERKVKKVG